jgi:hypothetical protein
MKWEIKRNDTKARVFRLTGGGTSKGGADLRNATVRFLMKPDPNAGPANGPTVNRAVTVLDAPTGKVEYAPDVADVAVAGLYRAEFESVWQDGTRLTFPENDYITVVILPDLGP